MVTALAEVSSLGNRFKVV